MDIKTGVPVLINHDKAQKKNPRIDFDQTTKLKIKQWFCPY